MIAHILSTGDEVLLGDIVDTNSAYLCSQAKDMGIEIQKIVAVGDDTKTIADIIKAIASDADICFVTGGLGPTQDDVTAQACSMAAGKEWILHPQALASMTSFFEKKGFKLNKDNEKQAMLPEGSIVLENHNGTAPGFCIKIDKCWFYFMPGVPSEMKLMFESQVKSSLADTFDLTGDIVVERLTVFGLPESAVGAKLKGFENLFSNMRLGFRAKFPVIEVKIVCAHKGSDKRQVISKMSEAKQWAVDHLENRVVSQTGLSLEEEVGKLLAAQNKTLAIAESCTGGLISNMVTNVAGSSDYFLFSAVTYSNDAKMNILGVKEETLVENGAVHETTAAEMATGARLKSNADFAVSTSGIAGPGGGTKEKPVGTVCIGLAGRDFSTGTTYVLNYGDRYRNKQIFATLALELLRRKLADDNG